MEVLGCTEGATEDREFFRESFQHGEISDTRGPGILGGLQRSRGISV